MKYVPYPLLVLFSARKNDYQCGFEEATDKPMTLDFGRSAPKTKQGVGILFSQGFGGPGAAKTSSGFQVVVSEK